MDQETGGRWNLQTEEYFLEMTAGLFDLRSFKDHLQVCSVLRLDNRRGITYMIRGSWPKSCKIEKDLWEFAWNTK